MKTNLLGENIKILRENSGFSQTVIAKFLNVDQSFVSKIEKGERPISSDMLEKLAALFAVRLDVFDQEIVEPSKTTVAFRGKNLTCEDMEVICTINRIAMNLDFMSDLMGVKDSD